MPVKRVLKGKARIKGLYCKKLNCGPPIEQVFFNKDIIYKTNQITVPGHHRPASDTPFKWRVTSLLASSLLENRHNRSLNLKSDCFISTSVCLLAKY